MRQEALATIENYNKAQKLGESFHIPSKIISPEGYKRKQENIEALKTDIRNILGGKDGKSK